MLKVEVRGNPGSRLFTSFGNAFNAAIEPKAKVKFTCSTLTGAYMVTASDIQVIAGDGVTPWETTGNNGKYYLGVFVFQSNGEQLFGVTATLVQQPTGLFGATMAGALYSPSTCAPGNVFVAFGQTTAESLSSPAPYEFGAQGTL